MHYLPGLLTLIPGTLTTVFSANNSALFQDVVTDEDLAQGHIAFEVEAFV